MNSTLNMHRCKTIEVGPKVNLESENGHSFVTRKVTFTGDNGNVFEINIFGDPEITLETINVENKESLP